MTAPLDGPAARNATASTFNQRATALAYKGKRRDNAALDYLVGVRAGWLAAQGIADANTTAITTPFDGLLFMTALRGADTLLCTADACPIPQIAEA